jgi:hypothetical protein
MLVDEDEGDIPAKSRASSTTGTAHPDDVAPYTPPALALFFFPFSFFGGMGDSATMDV